MEALGFYVCDTDLEHELVRALGVDAVLRIVDEQRELSSFRTFQKQPREAGARPRGAAVAVHVEPEDPVRDVLVEALDLERVPRPLDGA